MSILLLQSKVCLWSFVSSSFILVLNFWFYAGEFSGVSWAVFKLSRRRLLVVLEGMVKMKEVQGVSSSFSSRESPVD